MKHVRCNGICKPTFMRYDKDCPVHGWVDERDGNPDESSTSVEDYSLSDIKEHNPDYIPPVTGEEVKYVAMSPNNTELIEGWYKDAKGNNFQLIKVTLPVTGESEAIGERKFTLKEALQIWEAGYEKGYADEFGISTNPTKKQYFKDKFGIDI